MIFLTDKIKRVFYKYYNMDSENVNWLTVTPYEDISGLVYMDEYEVILEEHSKEWDYHDFMRNLLNTNT